MKRCPRDGKPIELTDRQRLPVYCLRGGSCGVALCPLSWAPNRPPSEIVKALSERAEAARRRQAKAAAGVRSKWAKRRAKLERRKATAAERAAKRAAEPKAVRPTPATTGESGDPRLWRNFLAARANHARRERMKALKEQA